MSQIPTMPVPNSTTSTTAPCPPPPTPYLFFQRANVKFSALSIRASMETSPQFEWATMSKYSFTLLYSATYKTKRLKTNWQIFSLFNSPNSSKDMIRQTRPRKDGTSGFSLKRKYRVVTKISSCQVNTTSTRGIKQLGISSGSIFLLFSNKSRRELLS